MTKVRPIFIEFASCLGQCHLVVPSSELHYSNTTKEWLHFTVMSYLCQKDWQLNVVNGRLVLPQ